MNAMARFPVSRRRVHDLLQLPDYLVPHVVSLVAAQGPLPKFMNNYCLSTAALHHKASALVIGTPPA